MAWIGRSTSVSKPTNRSRLRLQVLEDRSTPATWNYFGSGLGDSSDPSNWVEGVAPADGSDIYIPANTGGMDLKLSAVGNLTVESGWAHQLLTHGLSVNNGGILDSASVELEGDFTVAGGVLDVGGATFDNATDGQQPAPQVITGPGGTTTVKDDKIVVINGPARNDGTVTFENGILACMTTDNLTNNGTIQISGTGKIVGDATLLNYGQILQDKGDSAFAGPVKNLGGQIQLQKGNMWFTGYSGIPYQNSLFSSGGTITISGGTSLWAINGIYSESDTILVPPNLADQQTGHVAQLQGDLIAWGDTIILGGLNSDGQMLLSQTGSATLNGCTVQATLNWAPPGALPRLDDWSVTSLTIFGGIYAMGVLNEPNPVPANSTFLAFVSQNPIAGDFGSYLIGPNYTHSIVNGNQIQIKTVGNQDPDPDPNPGSGGLG